MTGLVLVPDALEANRAGRLTEQQRKNLRAASRGVRKGELWFAGALTVMGLLVWFAEGPPKYANIKPVIGIACLIIAGALVVRAILGADARTRDLRSGRVESAEGAVTKWVVNVDSHGTSSSTHYVQVGKVRVETGSGFYQQVPEAGMVRIFYLPESHHLVNLEQLADLPVPEGALTDPRAAMSYAKQAIAGSLTGDPIKEAEARAELAAMGNVLKAQYMKGGAAPPSGQRDPRPLAEAILGTWKNMMVTVTFSGDGSVAAAMSAGMQLSGHWSVDPAGHLVSDVMGTESAGDAWIVGDKLTLTLAGDGVVLQRVG